MFGDSEHTIQIFFGVMDLTAGYHQAPVSLGTGISSIYLFLRDIPVP
jgi:hypothetical protein